MARRYGHGPTRYTRDDDDDGTGAYRGYIIARTSDGQSFHVSKDGQHICYAPTAADARKAVDELTPC